MPRLAEVIESHPDSLKIEGRNRSEYYVGSVVHAYRCALDDYARDPEHFDPAKYMDMLNVLESRGYTTAFFDGPVPPDAHNYESARSSSEYHAAGVVTGKTDSEITLELRNEIRAGEEITFVLPHSSVGTNVKLPQILDAKSRQDLPKQSAGQHNAILIPRAWVDDAVWNKISPLVLAYKHK